MPGPEVGTPAPPGAPPSPFAPWPHAQEPPSGAAVGDTSASLAARARTFAAEAHASQTRRDGHTPYVTHLDAVAGQLRDLGVTDAATLAAAYLHDVLEDTPVPEAQVRRLFGDEVAGLVVECTNAKGEPRERYVRRFGSASAKACLVKLSDRLHNLRDWVGMEPGYRKVYAAEGLEIVAHVLRNRHTRAWSGVERAAARALAKGIVDIAVDEHGL
jgi:(p)ppGpp synthase/HD superfamily hydrolase